MLRPKGSGRCQEGSRKIGDSLLCHELPKRNQGKCHQLYYQRIPGRKNRRPLYCVEQLCEVGSPSETERENWGRLYGHRPLCQDRETGKRPVCSPQFCDSQKRSDLCFV